LDLDAAVVARDMDPIVILNAKLLSGLAVDVEAVLTVDLA
jgi:hypothetical protein